MVIRSFGVSFSILGQFIATVILLEAAPTAFQNIGYKFWIILICLTVVYAVWVYFFLPEVSSNVPCSKTHSDQDQTKGMTLEDISVLFGDPVELSFEQAMVKQDSGADGEAKTHTTHVESLSGPP